LSRITSDLVDLIVRNVRLADRPSADPVDIGVAGGKIVAIGPGLAEAKETYDAGGRLACPGLIETHIHLDKSRIIDRCPPEAQRDISPMKQVAAMKPGFTVEGVRRRAERTLVECILNGTTRMRTQVEVDPAIGMRGFDGCSR
jgi:cytosine deaminase